MEQSQENPNLGPQSPEKNVSPEKPQFQPEGPPTESPEKKPEKVSSPENTPSSDSSSSSLVLPQVSDQPVVVDDTKQGGGPQDNDFPIIADDVDVIEKEWVDKAKEIIRDTKDNPYAQEEAVERLQADYLKKRYGKDIKTSS